MPSENRVAVVTGAARGIGRRVALTLAERGYAVGANDLDPPEGTLDELGWVGKGGMSLPGEVADEDAVRGMVEWGGRVNAVCPAWVETEMDVEDQAGGGYTYEDVVGRVPMGRLAKPEDVARAVASLADPQQSAFVNGQTLSVDGGWFADGGWESLRRRKQDI